MLGSTLLGFSAILPGRKVAVGDAWQWKGDLLNIYKCDKLVGQFKLEAADDQQVRISCRINQGWHDVVPEIQGHLVYSQRLGVPVSSRFDYKSKRREQHLHTEARWIPEPAKARNASKASAVKAPPASKGTR